MFSKIKAISDNKLVRNGKAKIPRVKFHLTAGRFGQKSDHFHRSGTTGTVVGSESAGSVPTVYNILNLESKAYGVLVSLLQFEGKLHPPKT